MLETNGLSVVDIERCGAGDEWFKCCGNREMWCWRRMV